LFDRRENLPFQKLAQRLDIDAVQHVAGEGIHQQAARVFFTDAARAQVELGVFV
jgi:hypothetical protein